MQVLCWIYHLLIFSQVCILSIYPLHMSFHGEFFFQFWWDQFINDPFYRSRFVVKSENSLPHPGSRGFSPVFFLLKVRQLYFYVYVHDSVLVVTVGEVVWFCLCMSNGSHTIYWKGNSSSIECFCPFARVSWACPCEYTWVFYAAVVIYMLLSHCLYYCNEIVNFSIR